MVLEFQSLGEKKILLRNRIVGELEYCNSKNYPCDRIVNGCITDPMPVTVCILHL